MKRILFALFFSCVVMCLCAQELVSYRLNLVRHPETKKYGYAFKEQNINSPIRGTTSAAVNVLGAGASVLIGKSNADNIDWAIPPQYDDAASKFRENLAMVKVNGKVGFIDLYNRFIIEPVYDDVDDMDGFHQGVAAVKKDGKWGYINKEGECVIPFEYDAADAFGEDLIAPVKVGELWGAIDIEGNVLVAPEKKVKAAMITVPGSNKAYRAALAEVRERKSNGSYDARLNSIQQVSAAVNRHIADGGRQHLEYTNVGSDNMLGVVDNYGRVIVPDCFSEVIYDSSHGVYIVKKDNLYGAYLYNGSRLIAPCFDEMSMFSDGKSTVVVSGVSGWIDAEGNLAPSLLYDLLNAGIEAQNTNRYQARMIYERILKINPEYARAYNNIALLDIAGEDYSEGMKKLKLAHELDPNDDVITKNLNWAKESRKERRKERWANGLAIATAVLGVATTTYSTYSAIKHGVDSDAATAVPASSYATTDYDTSSHSSSYSDSSSSSSSKKSKTSSSSSVSDRDVKWLQANYSSQKRVYSDYESQLIKMDTYPETYNASQCRQIQSSMKSIRETIVSHGGTCSKSSWETWTP